MCWKVAFGPQTLMALFISKSSKDLEVRVTYEQRHANVWGSSEASGVIMHGPACFKDIY